MVRRTNWHVITGAPCSGKTTLIQALEASGHRVVHEAARAYMEEQMALGIGLELMKSDILAFEREILHRKILVESNLPGGELIFFDRAVPDSIAYYRLCGLNSTEAETAGRLVRYGRILFLDCLELETDDVRKEDQVAIVKLERLLEDCYRQLGYPIVRIPVMSVEDRQRLIISMVTASGRS
jgi:predicted ATPase